MLPLIVLTAAVVAAGACDSNDQVAAIAGPVPIPSPTVLQISPDQVTIVVGTTFQLSTNAGASQQGQLQWSSSNTSVATVSPTGLVAGFAPGAATITARFNFDTTHVASASVIVTAPPTP